MPLAVPLAIFAAALAGCAGQTVHREGMDLLATGHEQEGLAKLEQAAREAPDNAVYQIAYRNARLRIAERQLTHAQHEKSVGQYDAAEALYRNVLKLDPGNASALAGLAALDQARAHSAILAEARSLMESNDLAGAETKVHQVLKENPAQTEARGLREALEARIGRETGMPAALRAPFLKPVTLEFREANLRQVLEALSAHSGLNFVIDKDVPSGLVVTVFLRKVSVADALDLILTTRQLRSRVLNDNSLLIYPDTVAKQSEHQELLVRNFFLANAEAKQVANMLRTVLKVKTVFADDKLNLVVMRDTPSMVQLAERLVITHDVAEPEVMLELAVLEVTRSQLSSLGIEWPSQLTLTPLPRVAGATLTLTDLKNLNSDRIGATIGPLSINLQDDSNASNLLANPRIRTHNREKALIKIGDRVPVITTTATSTGFVSENVQYIDVGLKLEVEPVIFPNDEISLKLALEVSSVVREIVSQAGTSSYQIGARNAATVLRLKDGETQVLGGLINDDDRRSANRVPGLGRLPILGRLFSSENANNSKTELVLSVTPRIVRGLMPPTQVPAKFWSGTESDPRVRAVLSATPGAAGPAPAADSPVSSRGSVTVMPPDQGAVASPVFAPAAPAPMPVPAPESQPPIPSSLAPPAPAAAPAEPATAAVPASALPPGTGTPPVIYGPALLTPPPAAP